MSEKRFGAYIGYVFDNSQGRTLRLGEVVDLLNEQDRKIKELEKENDDLKVTIMVIDDE